MKRPLRILLVEDTEDLLDLIGLLLEMDDANVTYASSYYEAIKKFETGTFDLVITDWRMPKMHGLYLVDIVKSQRPEIPVIVMSAYLSDEILNGPIRKKVDLFLRKPFEYEDLHSGILKLVRKSDG